MSEDELDVVIGISQNPTSRELELLFIIARLDVTLIKKEKVIDLMADYIYEHDISTTGLYEWRDNEQIKECFYKEVEEEK